MVGTRGGRVGELETALEGARAYRDVMWGEAERTRGWGGQSHRDRLAEYGRAARQCRDLAEALGDALRDEALALAGL
jgi:hypothetical protein